MSKTDGGPAFPSRPADMESGMTLRDYFAAKAMASLIGHLPNLSGREGESRKETVARQAYDMADAMLKARG